jgi:hypothetical protein
MGFLRIVFHAFLDSEEAVERAREIFNADIPSPSEARGYTRRPTAALAELSGYWKKTRRHQAAIVPLVPIVGNLPRDPNQTPDLRPFLDPTDPAYTALVKRGTDLWVLDRNDPSYTKLEELGLPHGAGISGSTADLVALGKIVGLSPELMAQYAMAILYFVGLPGHHSFAEIAFVLAANGVASFHPRPYHGDYAGPLTAELTATPGYQRLAAEFPEQLLTS